MCLTNCQDQGNARNGSHQTMNTDRGRWVEAKMSYAAIQLGPEAETGGWFLTSGTMSEECGREKHVTMREQH